MKFKARETKTLNSQHAKNSLEQPASNTIQPVWRSGRFASLRAISALMIREMATTYSRSAGGYVWAILEPVGAIIVLTVVFSAALRAPPIGDNFPYFYATGILPFMLYVDIQSKISSALTYSRPLLYYPAVTYIDAILARFILNFGTLVFVFCLVMTGLVFIFDIDSRIEFPYVLLSLSMAGALGLGIGTLNCFLFLLYPVWRTVWGIINRPIFLISGLFFIYEGIPEPYRSYLWYNPLMHVTGEMRRGFFPTYDPSYVSPLFVFGVSLGAFTLGLVLINAWHRSLLER